MLVRLVDAVSQIASFVQRDEEFLGVAVESALAGLIRVDLDEGVVAAFLAHAQRKISKAPRECARTCGVPGSLHANFREEFVSDAQDFHWHQLGPKEMSHLEF